MEWRDWAPIYDAILRDLGYSRADDEAARDALDAMLAYAWRADLDALAAEIRGRDVVVLGGATHGAVPDGPLLVADPRVVPPRRPLAIVTDLDGDVALQAALNAMEVPLFVHAHGDNLDALRAHVPALRGPLVGTTQAPPTARVACFGGFTDGDRACCIAAHLGAAALTLVGFDFDAPAPKPGKDPDEKRRKLAWARRIIDGLGVPARSL